MKYLIKNSVNCSSNHNHNVLCLLAIFKCLKLCLSKQKMFHEYKAVISFKFAKKDSIIRKTSWKFPMHYEQIQKYCVFFFLIFTFFRKTCITSAYFLKIASKFEICQGFIRVTPLVVWNLVLSEVLWFTVPSCQV